MASIVFYKEKTTPDVCLNSVIKHLRAKTMPLRMPIDIKLRFTFGTHTMKQR